MNKHFEIENLKQVQEQHKFNIMSAIQYQTISGNKIYKANRPRSLKNYSNYDISSRLRTITSQSNSEMHQNLSSITLTEYEQSLKNQLRTKKIKQLQRRERKKNQTIQTLMQNQRESRIKSKRLISQLQTIKYRLKSIGLQRQSDMIRKQRALLLQNSFENQKRNLPTLFPQLSVPNYNPYQFPVNPYPYHPNIYPHLRMSDSQTIDFQNNQRYYSQPISAHRRKNRSINPLRNDSDYLQTPNQQKKILPISKDQKIITKTQFHRNKFKKRMNDFKRFQNKQNNTKRLKKCFLAVYFSVILRRVYQKMINQRKKFFLQFWPEEYVKFQQTFQQFFYSKFLPFFKLLKEKQYSPLLPSEDDTKILQLQKKRTVRQFIRVFFQCLRPFKNIQNLGKIAWGFCSHGSYADKGVLTVNQLQFVSFDEKQGYLRMDKNLQKSQIISFIFLKIVIFKFLLHPQRKWQKQFNPSDKKFLLENLKLIASILYDLFITLQDEYMSSADLEKYPVGNYKDFKAKMSNLSLQFSRPLMYETKKVENEIISGLYPQQFLKKNIGFKKILPNLQIAKEVIEGIHSASKQYDRTFRSKVLKFVPRVDYKY